MAAFTVTNKYKITVRGKHGKYSFIFEKDFTYDELGKIFFMYWELGEGKKALGDNLHSTPKPKPHSHLTSLNRYPTKNSEISSIFCLCLTFNESQVSPTYIPVQSDNFMFSLNYKMFK